MKEHIWTVRIVVPMVTAVANITIAGNMGCHCPIIKVRSLLTLNIKKKILVDMRCKPDIVQ